MEKLRPGRVEQPGLVVGSLGGSGVEAGGAGGWAPCPQTTSAPLGLWGGEGQASGAGGLTTQLQGPPTPWWSSPLGQASSREWGHWVSGEGAVSNSQPCSASVGSVGHGPQLRSRCGAELPAQGCALGPGGRDSSLPARW